MTYKVAAYDAAYLALAEVEKCDLWTGDRAFYQAVKGESPRVKWIGDYKAHRTMFKYQSMTDSVKELSNRDSPPPDMTQDEFDAMVQEMQKEKALLRLSDRQILALNLDELDDWELVIAAERLESMGRHDLWLEALKRVCRSSEHNVMIWYGDVYSDVVEELRYQRDYEQAIFYQQLAIEEDQKYCDGMNSAVNKRDLGDLYIEAGDYEKGLEIFTEMVQQDPWDVWTYNSLAITFCMLGFSELATLAAQKGIAVAKATGDPEHLLEQLHELIDDAKQRSFDARRKQIAPETYEKWKQLISYPLPHPRPKPRKQHRD
jgi:tetratricopeptide (TPR) repeat protein